MAPQVDDVEPSSVKEAQIGPNSAMWRATMSEELDSIRTNQVWGLFDQPRGERVHPDRGSGPQPDLLSNSEG